MALVRRSASTERRRREEFEAYERDLARFAHISITDLAEKYQAKELATYRSLPPEFWDGHAGEYVLIYGETIEFHPNLETVMEAGFTMRKPGEVFLVRPALRP